MTSADSSHTQPCITARVSASLQLICEVSPGNCYNCNPTPAASTYLEYLCTYRASTCRAALPLDQRCLCMRFMFFSAGFCSDGFLQTTPRGERPCLLLAVPNLSHIVHLACSGLAPYSYSPCRAHTNTAWRRAGR